MAYVKQINVSGVAYDIKAAADLSGNLIESSYLKLSGGTMTGNLLVNVTGDIALADTTNGPLQIGPITGYNLAFDVNEIMARNNKTASTLYINDEGGTVSCGGDVISKGALYTGNKRTYNDANKGAYIGADGTIHLTHATGAAGITFHHAASTSNTATLSSRSDGALQVSSQTTTGAAIRNIYAGTGAPSGGSNGEVFIRYL